MDHGYVEKFGKPASAGEIIGTSAAFIIALVLVPVVLLLAQPQKEQSMAKKTHAHLKVKAAR